MTDDDKKRIAEYMKWESVLVGPKKSPYMIYIDNIDPNIYHKFDLNDAGLCVQEMQKRGDWEDFMAKVYGVCHFHKISSATAWLFNAENFFNAMSEWLKERGK